MPDPNHAKPLPRINRLSRPFWQGAQQHVLLLQRCSNCGKFRFPPSASCPACLQSETEWVRASGRGKVWSWIRMWQRYFPAFDADRPYVVAYVELEEGPRMMTTLVGIPPEEITCDMAVEVVFDDVTASITLPKFAPARKR